MLKIADAAGFPGERAQGQTVDVEALGGLEVQRRARDSDSASGLSYITMPMSGTASATAV